MRKKEYPLDVEYSSVEEPAYWTKGHHDPAAFCAEIMESYDPDDFTPDPSDVRRTYWRYDIGTELYMEARGPAPGAFPVTYILA